MNINRKKTSSYLDLNIALQNCQKSKTKFVALLKSTDLRENLRCVKGA